MRSSLAGKKDIVYLILLLLLGYVLFLRQLSSPALYDLDEGGYAEIARETLVLNDWVLPHFDFVRLLDKPPLLYWLTALSFKLLGPSEFSARLPVVISTLGCLLLCYFLGSHLFSQEAGLFSALIFSSCAGISILGMGWQLLPDMIFTFFLSLTFAMLILSATRPSMGQGYIYFGWLAMGLAVMTKGLLGLLFPLMTTLLYVLISRDTNLFRRLRLISGGALSLGVVVPWHLLVELKTPGFLRFYLFDVHTARFFHQGSLAADDTTSLSLLAFLGVTALWFSPWTIFLPMALLNDLSCWRRGRGTRTQEGKAITWLWLWSAVIMGFFSLSLYRMDNYALPAFPALSLLVGRLWAGLVNRKTSPFIERGVTAGSLFLTGTLLLITGLFGLLFRYDPFSPYLSWLSKSLKETIFDDKVALLSLWDNLRPLYLAGGASIVVGFTLTSLVILTRRYRLAMTLMIFTLLVLSLCSKEAAPFFEPYLSSKVLATEIDRHLRKGEEVVIVKVGRYEDVASLSFYTGQKIYLLNGRRDDLLFGSSYPDGSEVFLSQPRFIRLWQSDKRVFLITDILEDDQDKESLLYAGLRSYVIMRGWRFHLYTNHPIEEEKRN